MILQPLPPPHRHSLIQQCEDGASLPLPPLRHGDGVRVRREEVERGEDIVVDVEVCGTVVCVGWRRGHHC